MSVIRDNPGIREWIVAGHSRGAVVSSAMADRRLSQLAGLVLIGTTHPRDVDLSQCKIKQNPGWGSCEGS